MRLPVGLTVKGAAYYAAYRVFGAHLPYRPRGLRALRTRLVNGYAPGVDRTAVVNKRARISPGARVMQGAGVGEGSSIPSGVILRRHVMMGPGCVFLTGDHPVPGDGEFFGDYEPVHGAIDVGEDVFIGARAIILPGVTIGRGAAIGAGSVVAKDVPPGATVVGNPARVVRTRTPPPPLEDRPYPSRAPSRTGVNGE